jgi:voltage-gated potassium channel
MSFRDQPTPHGLRYKVFEIVEKGDPQNKKSLYFDYFIIGLVLLNVLAIILESFASLKAEYKQPFYVFEVFSVIVFTIEYLMRLWTAPLKHPQLRGIAPYFKFSFSFLAIIDLLAILPFYLPIFMVVDLRLLRMLRIIRLLRILKLNRYSRSLSILGRVLVEKKADLLATIFIALILIIIASTLMYNLEHELQPDAFPNIVETLWWAVATLTTVGYGDVYPITGWGRLLSGAIALLGIGIVALPTGILSSGYLEELQATRRQEAEALAEKRGESSDNAAENALPLVAGNLTCVCPHCQNEISLNIENAK